MSYKEKIKLMCEMQEKLNDHTISGWREKGLDWPSAIMVEASELIDPMYKWWKHGDPDVENIKVETIDIFHFFMSYHMDLQLTPQDISEQMQKALSDSYSKELHTKAPQEAITLSKKLVKAILSYDSGDSYKYMSDLIAMFFPNFDDFARGYLVKNILNTYRQNHGYKDGTYKKMWIFNGTEVEDNVATFALANEIGLDDSFEVNLISAMDSVYKEQ